MNISSERKADLRRRFKLFATIFKLVLFIGIIVGIPLYLYFFQHDIIEQFSSMENVEQLFQEYRSKSILIYIAAQILQIVICIIPGQWLQFAAGYMYGFGLGYLFSLIGAFFGTILTYYIAKILGHDAMHMIFGEERIKKMLKTLNSKKAVILVFIIFLIPGVPKDLCNYVAGLSEISLKRFLVVSLIGRTPGMMGSLLIGRQIHSGGYVSAAIIAGVAVVLFLLMIIFRKHLTEYLNKGYDKLMKM